MARLINQDALKAEIAEALSISAVAERLCDVDLQRSGHQWTGLCPLHNERTPSFNISDGKGVFHCFGCKEGGDAIDLVRKVRHLDYIEAIYLLAAEADIEIEKYERPMTPQEQEQARIRAWAEDWIGLFDHRIERGTEEVAAIFDVGSMPVNKETVPPWLSGKDYLVEGTIFPYRAPSGRLVGWKTRHTDGKMFGTPVEFPLHEETLFGIQVAREGIAGGALTLVEGEYDCLTAYQWGIRNVAAMGGSALTSGHMDLLESLHVRSVTVILDGDTGGRKAAKSIAERFWSHKIGVRIAICPDGLDPDEAIPQLGLNWFIDLVSEAKHALEYLLWLEWTRIPRDSLSDKLDFVSWIQEHYGAKLRTTDESLILAEVARWMDIPAIEVQDFVRQSDTSLQAVDSERILMGECVRNVHYYVQLRKRVSGDDFYLLKHQRMWDVLARMVFDGLDFDPATIGKRAAIEGIGTEYIEELATVHSSNLSYHEDQILDLSLRRAARDDAVAFKNSITDMNVSSDLAVGDLTHKITERALRKTGAAVRQLGEQVDMAMDTLHERMSNPSEIHGLDLGAQFPETSKILQGLQARRFVLIAATSGVGKSTFMIQVATSLSVHQSIPTDVISLEMDELEVLNKMASHMTGIDSMAISGGALDSSQMKRVEKAMAAIRSSPVHIWAPDGMNAIEFTLYARESVMQRKTEAFFVDYVQLTDPDPGMERDNGYTQYGHFGRMAKMKVARAMEVAVVCCAQLTRNAASKERPTKEDMGDSYALVRHADVIMILAGQEDSATTDLWIDKNRQGLGGNVLKPLIYEKPYNTFREASTGAKAPEYLIQPEGD